MKLLNCVLYLVLTAFIGFFAGRIMELSFVPMYIAPKLRKICLGKPIHFHAEESMDAERSRICTYLMDEITAVAEALPEHTVVPYRNIPKKNYPTNRPKESAYEKTGG